MKELKEYRKEIRLSEKELQMLNRNAKASGLNVSDYIRCLINNIIPKEKPDNRFYEVMKLMRAISINLNQIAVKANTLGFIDELQYKKESKKWNEFMLQVKEEFLSPKN